MHLRYSALGVVTEGHVGGQAVYRMLFECYSRIGIVWFRHAMDEKRLNEYCVFLKEALPAHIRRNARPWGVLGPKNRYPHIFLDLTVQIK